MPRHEKLILFRNVFWRVGQLFDRSGRQEVLRGFHMDYHEPLRVSQVVDQ
jgi:hypothetical protein